MIVERDFQATLIREIKNLLPDCEVVKTDPTYIQGFPDLLILSGDRWGALECKRGLNARKRPNQDYYISKLNGMSFASFICPENKEEVLDELQQAFKPKRNARVPKPKQVPLD